MKNQINDSRKEIILHTARDLLIKNGFAKTTLDDIANAIGMKKSSLYYYYSNKDSLFDDIMMREEKYFCSLVAEALKKSETVLTKSLAMSTGQGSENWQPLGIATVGGLLFSSIITLVLVPVLYSVFETRIKKKKEID